MSKVVVFGNGQVAEVAYFYLTQDSEHEVVGFTVDKDYMNKQSFWGLPVVPFEDIEKYYPPSLYNIFIPIPYTKLNKLREERYLDAKKRGYQFISYISSKAIYYGTCVGENCFILENNVIQPFVEIGNNVILWSGNHIGHHSKIEDHCFLASHIVVSGSVTIESHCFIGVNATIRDNIVIGKQSIIGAGTLVLNDIPDKSVLIGNKTEPRGIKSNSIRQI